MKSLFCMMMFLSAMESSLLFDFNKTSSIDAWSIVDDVVMGGRSSGAFGLNEDGHAVFSGNISLENYGGFSSVRHRFPTRALGAYTKVVLKIKGDGKRYQFRVKDKSNQNYSYITTFQSSGEWEEIEISLQDMYPSFRGRKLDMPNFSAGAIEEIVFLIGNNKEERFQLLIDEISLR